MTSITSSAGPLDVQGLVSQLMAVERQPYQALQAKASKYKTQLSDLGSLQSDLSSLQSSMTSLSTGTFINASKLTSSTPTALTGSTTDFAVAGVYNVNVSQIAQGQNIAYTGLGSATASLGNAANQLTFTFADGTTPATIAIKAGASLNDIASAVNSAGAGINATVVNTGDPANPSTLVFNSTQTGAGKTFSTSLQSSDATLNFLKYDSSVANDTRLTQKAQDAVVSINGVSMHSSNNTLTTGINGVSLNLSTTGQSTVTIARDNAAIQASVQKFVDAYNKVLKTTKSLQNGSLQGSPTMQSVNDMLRSVLTQPISGVDPTKELAYLAQLGITQNGTSTGANGSAQLDGSLKFDATAFTKVLDADPAAVAKVFGNSNNDGVADRFNARINEMLGPTGLLQTATKSVNDNVAQITLKEDQEQTRLDSIQTAYLTQFSNLNASLMQMQKTSSYLASAIAAA